MKKPSRLKAILFAILVTIIWSTSWIFIKIGLEDVPPMTFAGLRYVLASLVLIPFLFKKEIKKDVKSLKAKDWMIYILLGIVLYTVGQGGQYLGLAYLPSVSVSLILNLGALLVAIISTVIIKEKPNWLQWVGVLLNLAGIIVYFYSGFGAKGSWLGWFFSILSLLGNSVGTIIGRKLNATAHVHPIMITAISMTIGSVLMLTVGILWQGLPPLSLKSIGIIVLLATLNTAMCFSLWNYTQQTLTATESTIINNTMLVHIAILAWIFLGEKQTFQGIIGLILSIAGAMLVQIKLRKRSET